MQNLEIKEISSDTKDLGVVDEGSKVPEDIKMLRAFIKEACEEAGFSYAKTFKTVENEYFIKYEWGFNIRFAVGESHYGRFIVQNDHQDIEIQVVKRGTDPEVIDKIEHLVADPNFFDDLVVLVKKMNRGYND